MTTNTDVHTCSYYCERPECVRRQRDELRDRMEAVLAQQPPSVPVGVEEMQRRLDREESDHGRTIDQRDAAEDALGRMFQAVTGRVAEWSSAWGYTDAIEEVEEHVAALAQQPAAPSGERGDELRIAALPSDVAHEIWAAAQLAPGEGIVDGVARVEALLSSYGRPAAVDDAMVDRAGQALYGTDWGSFERWEADQLRRKVRAVLAAALAAQQQGGAE